MLFIISSCSYKQDERLLDWSSEFVMQDDGDAEGYYQNHIKFIEPYFSSEYKADTLKVTTLIEINSCAEIIADIKISNDTLYLLTKNIGNVACASVTFNKFTYVIHNISNEKFVIISEE